MGKERGRNPLREEGSVGFVVVGEGWCSLLNNCVFLGFVLFGEGGGGGGEEGRVEKIERKKSS